MGPRPWRPDPGAAVGSPRFDRFGPNRPGVPAASCRGSSGKGGKGSVAARCAGACLLAVAAAWTAGCAGVKQVQYFEVVGDPDPLTGIAPKNFYRMTLRGTGGGGVMYKLRAAYVSGATLDTLNGQIPSIPEADLPEANANAFAEIKDDYLRSLTDYAEVRANLDPADAGAHEQRVAEISRQAWFASLQDADLISLGQVHSTDPFRFRRLVFYASAENIDLEDYDAQINSVLERTGTLARALKAQRQARRAERASRKRAARDAAQRLIALVGAGDDAQALLVSLLELLVPGEQEHAAGDAATEITGDGA